MQLYLSANSNILSDVVITVDSFVQLVHNRDESGIKAILSKGEGRNIPILRQFVYEVFSSLKLTQEEYWTLVSVLLAYDRRVYRKPITDAATATGTIKSYRCPQQLFDTIVPIMLEDKDKVLDGLRFLHLFKGCINESHKRLLIDSASNITVPEGFSLLYDLLNLTTEQRIDFACEVDTLPALYSLYLELAFAEEQYGIWHIQGLSNFPDRLNALPDRYEVQIIFDLIEKNVLHEDIEDSTGLLNVIERDGFEAFAKMSKRHYAKVASRDNIKAISSYCGETLSCMVVARYERHYLVRTLGRFAMSGLLPIVLAEHNIPLSASIQCTVVSVIKSQKLLILTQKPCNKKFAESIPVLTEGKEYEAKFCLYNKKIIPEILGFGPVRANLISIPRNFDYKKHHMVRVISSQLASCVIEIIHKL